MFTNLATNQTSALSVVGAGYDARGLKARIAISNAAGSTISTATVAM